MKTLMTILLGAALTVNMLPASDKDHKDDKKNEHKGDHKGDHKDDKKKH